MTSKIISFNKDKRAISIMIGYILLITSAVVMSAIVFQWMKSYVPKDAIDCPEGVSLFITDSSCGINTATNDYQLRLSVKNNGRFDVAGYFIHATDRQDQTLATIDLSNNSISGGTVYNNAILFLPLSNGLQNFFKPDSPPLMSVYSLDSKLYKVEIIPVRFQTHENKKRLVSCGKAKVFEDLKCEEFVGGEENDEEIPEDCVPDCTDKECGSDSCGGNCGDLAGECAEGFICESGICACTDTCESLGYNCGEVCGISCGTCDALQTCTNGYCIG